MKFDWDPRKNETIKDEHGISFDEIVDLISKGFMIKTMKNPSKKYKGQKVILVRKGNSIFMVPYEIRNKKRRLINRSTRIRRLRGGNNR